MKNTALVIGIVLLSILIIGLAYISQDKNLCCKYEFCSKFISKCDEGKGNVMGMKLTSRNGDTVILDNLKSNDTHTVGYIVEGSALGSWYFEGVFPVRAYNSQGEIIRTMFAETTQDWMTDESVPFTIELDIEIEQEEEITLRFEKSNPSTLQENSDYVEVTFRLKPLSEDTESETDMSSVKVFFANSKMNPEVLDCSLVFPVTRDIEETVAVGRASLLGLFSGPTTEEIEQGYYTSINDGVEILSLVIEDGVAKVDLNSKLQEGVGGSCKVTTIRAQIEETLKQFSTVDSVIISIDGQSEDILQP